RITRGVDRLRAMRLSPKGLTRWFADCCRTPVGNTLATPRVPFLGLICNLMDHTRDGRTRDSVFGPPLARIHARYAIDAAGLPKGAHRKVPLWFVLRAARFLGLAAIRDRNDPSVFFDGAGRMIVQPTVLTAAERERLYAGRG